MGLVEKALYNENVSLATIGRLARWLGAQWTDSPDRRVMILRVEDLLSMQYWKQRAEREKAKAHGYSVNDRRAR